MLEFEILAVGPLGCNCVLLWDNPSKGGIVVDPGDEAGRILDCVASRGVSILSILLTHTHFDHVGGAGQLQNQWGCEVYLHPDEAFLWDCLDEQTSSFGMPPIQKPRITNICEALPLGVKALHTPGHTPGSVAYLADSHEGKLALVGDTLFLKGVGRTDLCGGDWGALENSIRTKLYTLAPDTTVIPGHGPTTTIASERRENPYVRG